MYSTCIFCHSSLGKNEAVEHFPVGRKLAFDEAKGRLWAVCSKCGRWNLTPIEERWEAIEECEKLFRGTVMRSSTDQIGLGRVHEGTDLIRIGAPLRPEFAAWRYGKYFHRRRQMQWLVTGLSAVATGVVGMYGGPIVAFTGFTPLIARLLNRQNELGNARQFIVKRAEAGFNRKIWKHENVGVRLFATEDQQGWGLRFALDAKFLDFYGRDALHAAHLVAPAANVGGADKRSLGLAVREIEIAGSADAYFRRVVKYGQSKGWRYTTLSEYPEEMRLAFEMASHEESERAAIEGELQQLEADWREAEEVAAIADNLFLPSAITEFIAKHTAKA
jgi:hypothetical protein